MRGVSEDAAVDESSVHVGDHGAYVARAVGRARFRVFLAIDVILRCFVPVLCVAFIDTEDFSTWLFGSQNYNFF